MRKTTELRGGNWLNSREKRLMDLAYCSVALPVLLPVGLSALVLSRTIDGKGALFSHQRLGKDGIPFKFLKIRTLKDISSNVVSQGPSDPHATRLGRVLRPLGIDELPQILHILSGEMSVVGIRAAYPATIEAMKQALPRIRYDEWENAYFSSRPGMLSSYVIESRSSSITEAGSIHKANLDIKDFTKASFEYDNNVIVRAGRTAIGMLACKVSVGAN